jgi:hypothetical protein
MTFPSNPAEYEEYVSIMSEMADQAIASTPDPQPEDFGGRCEDAPCCGCCGNDAYDSAMEYERQREEFEDNYSPDEESDELRQREQDDEGRDDFDPEDRYLDSQWEDANEYGMEGCCGDF